MSTWDWLYSLKVQFHNLFGFPYGMMKGTYKVEEGLFTLLSNGYIR